MFHAVTYEDPPTANAAVDWFSGKGKSRGLLPSPALATNDTCQALHGPPAALAVAELEGSIISVSVSSRGGDDAGGSSYLSGSAITSTNSKPYASTSSGATYGSDTAPSAGRGRGRGRSQPDDSFSASGSVSGFGYGAGVGDDDDDLPAFGRGRGRGRGRGVGLGANAIPLAAPPPTVNGDSYAPFPTGVAMGAIPPPALPPPPPVPPAPPGMPALDGSEGLPSDGSGMAGVSGVTAADGSYLPVEGASGYPMAADGSYYHGVPGQLPGDVGVGYGDGMPQPFGAAPTGMDGE